MLRSVGDLSLADVPNDEVVLVMGPLASPILLLNEGWRTLVAPHD